MGRDSGFVAMHAATAADVVDLCMIPEVKVDMKEMQLRKKKTCFVMMEFCWDMFVASCSFVTCFFLNLQACACRRVVS